MFSSKTAGERPSRSSAQPGLSAEQGWALVVTPEQCGRAGHALNLGGCDLNDCTVIESTDEKSAGCIQTDGALSFNPSSTDEGPVGGDSYVCVRTGDGRF